MLQRFQFATQLFLLSSGHENGGRQRATATAISAQRTISRARCEGGYRAEEEADEFVETTMLVFLCLMVSGLLYFRGRWVERVRREEQERQQQQGVQANGAPPPQPPAGGLFPPPGDPARDNWPVR